MKRKQTDFQRKYIKKEVQNDYIDIYWTFEVDISI